VKPDRATDHLANERTFLAWLRTGLAVVIFGFAIGRFTLAIRQLAELSGRTMPTPGVSVWLGTGAILGGVLLSFVGLLRYRQTRRQLDEGRFEAAGGLIDFAGIFTAVFGIALAVYLLYIGFRL
jgi:putative membrane protein